MCILVAMVAFTDGPHVQTALVKFVVIIDDGGELASFGADENKGIGADIVWAKIMIKLFLRYILN